MHNQLEMMKEKEHLRCVLPIRFIPTDPHLTNTKSITALSEVAILYKTHRTFLLL